MSCPDLDQLPGGETPVRPRFVHTALRSVAMNMCFQEEHRGVAEPPQALYPAPSEEDGHLTVNSPGVAEEASLRHHPFRMSPDIHERVAACALA
jgi:hypothetical protein